MKQTKRKLHQIMQPLFDFYKSATISAIVFACIMYFAKYIQDNGFALLGKGVAGFAWILLLWDMIHIGLTFISNTNSNNDSKKKETL